MVWEPIRGGPCGCADHPPQFLTAACDRGQEATALSLPVAWLLEAKGNQALSPTCLKVVTIEDALKHSEGRVQRQGTWHPLVSRGAGLMPEVSIEVLSIPGLLPSQILGGFLWTRKARQPFSAGLIRRIKL